MEIEKLLETMADYSEPKNDPIGIAFTKTDAKKWRDLNKRLKRIDDRLELAPFARKSIKLVMLELEKWADQYEQISENESDPDFVHDSGPEAS